MTGAHTADSPTPTPAGDRSDAPGDADWATRRRRRGAGHGSTAVVVVVSIAARLPAFLADAHLTFDDGVFGASAVAMRDGGVPFRDVFSSQGPLFLPLVWLFDAVGLRTSDAPRLLAVVSGVVIALAVLSMARRLTTERAAVVCALAASLSGSVLWTSGPLAADGPGLALAAAGVAVALSYRDSPSLAKAVGMGALLGGAFAIKSLFAVPPGLAVAYVFLESGRWRDLGWGVATAGALVVAVSLPWGPADVWDQAVAYHLEAAGDRTPGANASKVVSTLWDRDLLVLVLAATGAVVGVLARRRPVPEPGDPGATPRNGRPYRWGGPVGPLAVWTVALVAVYLLEHPLWRPHLAHVVPPLALLAGYAWRRHARAFVAVAAVVFVGHVATTTDILWPSGYSATEARLVADLETLPDDCRVISDEPGFVWRAGLLTPHDLVDASILRIESERITGDSLERAAADPAVCAVVVWSHRFARFDLDERLDGYSVAETYGAGPRRLLLRSERP